MTTETIVLIIALFGVTLLCVKPLGLYIANVMEGKPIFPLRVGATFESAIYGACGVDPKVEMGWKHYAVALLAFNTLGVLFVYATAAVAGLAATESRRNSPMSRRTHRSIRRSVSSRTLTGRAIPVK